MVPDQSSCPHDQVGGFAPQTVGVVLNDPFPPIARTYI